MVLRKQTTDLCVYQIKVTLIGIEPPIWRRIQIPNDISLKKLHEILQIVMGWSNSHLHQFVIGGKYFAEPDPEYDPEVKNEKMVRLNQVISGVGERAIYEYDFGDNWEHELVIEKILPLSETVRYPICVAGQRACPPEDCGGIQGYKHFLEAIQNHDHPEHDEMLDWIGGDFDPEAFDLDEINRKIETLLLKNSRINKL
ncbi:MAG: plasmid pRiA4b ORF-3 family protein [bacterium]|nr:plasmid pRiA4b ORF-3 family protein [bacterium]